MNVPAVLARLSRPWGADPLLAQGAGGNVSFKSDGRLLIKRSGWRLRDLSAEEGWAEVDLRGVRSWFGALPRDATASIEQEARYLRVIGIGGGTRPSMESGLHALLPHGWVAHLHSVAGVVLAMHSQAEARRILRRAGLQAVDLGRVPPAAPGMELALQVSRLTPRPSPTRPLLALLANHGVVWAARDPLWLQQAVARFERVARSRFRLRAGLGPVPPVRLPYLVDSVAYQAAERVPQADLDEVRRAEALVASAALRSGRFRPLPPRLVAAIRGLAAERLRFAGGS